MHGIQQGIMEAGREFGNIGGRVFEAGGHGLDAMEITWIVLGFVLWAAVMTTLVMGMIALVRHLKGPKAEKSAKDDTPSK